MKPHKPSFYEIVFFVLVVASFYGFYRSLVEPDHELYARHMTVLPEGTSLRLAP